jgi:hypothetical protein
VKLERESLKIYVPDNAPPNIMGLLLGPRGSNQKRMEEESGAKIYIRGKGSSKGPARGEGHPDDDDEMHVAIDARDADSLNKARKLVEEILFDPERCAQGHCGRPNVLQSTRSKHYVNDLF